MRRKINKRDGVQGSFLKRVLRTAKILCFAGTVVLVNSACGAGDGSVSYHQPDSDIYSEKQTPIPLPKQSEDGELNLREQTEPSPAPQESEKPPKTYDKIDLDLSKLNDLLVYSELYNVVSEPEKHIGEVICLRGQFALYRNNVTNELLYACMITDATACCSQGIEFEPQESYSYPDDYPKIGKNITVTGVFESYEEDEETYYRLGNATVKK